MPLKPVTVLPNGNNRVLAGRKGHFGRKSLKDESLQHWRDLEHVISGATPL